MVRRAPKRPAKPSHAFPHDSTADQAAILETFQKVDTQVAVLLGDDPALGGKHRYSTPNVTPAGLPAPGPIPVALFEPADAIGQALPDGTMQELQTEAIIQAGFTRWRMVTALEHLTDWSVRQTTDGLELWDHGGIWARGAIKVPGTWWDSANRWGVVMVMYGVQLGVSNFGAAGKTSGDRFALLQSAKRNGVVAGALVTWRGLPIPDHVPFQGLTYDAATGLFEYGVGPGGARSHWRLNTPGQGVHHGLIIGEQGIGKTSALRLVMIEAMCSGRFAVWPADPSGRHDLSWAEKATDWIAHDRAETMRMLQAAVDIIPRRQAAGGCADPNAGKPGILIAIDECQHVFAGNREATRLGELIAAEGGSAGVALAVTSSGADLAYFGGSADLRAGLASGNCVGAGIDGLELLSKVRGSQ